MFEKEELQIGLRPGADAPERVLAVIDMQVDFVDGALGTPEAAAIVESVCRRIDECDGNTAVVVTLDTHGDDYLDTQEGRNLPVPHCRANSDGWRLTPEVASALERYAERTGRTVAVYLKPTFGSTALANDLRECDAAHRIGQIEFVGLCTDICVVSNALLAKAFLPETEIAVLADCCAGVTPEAHEAALATMASCQVRIARQKD